MLYYTIDKTALLESVEEEVSHAADAAYGENGASLYDSVVITEKDRDNVLRFIDDAVSLLVRRAFDICKYSPESYQDEYGEFQLSGRMRLALYVPDFDETMWDATETEISRYIVLYAAGALFQGRKADLVPEYTRRAQEAQDKAVILLKSRKYPE